LIMPPQGDPAARAWQVLEAIPDPEIPVLSIVDLGIVRELRWDGQRLQVAITPTYSGCPAAELIHNQVNHALAEAGFNEARVTEVLSPAWTTDWISKEGRDKLRQYGIAPPERGSGRRALSGSELAVPCPRCVSQRTECVSEFGSTPCKAQYRCLDCLEPFDYFKCL
jgi:ring-1,2-phenylacetyl-CoA epoxidase subunit PaaD